MDYKKLIENNENFKGCTFLEPKKPINKQDDSKNKYHNRKQVTNKNQQQKPSQKKVQSISQKNYYPKTQIEQLKRKNPGFEQLCNIYTGHKPQKIFKLYKEYNFDKQNTANRLLSQPQDMQAEKSSSFKNQKHTTQQRGQKLLNQVLDCMKGELKLQINEFQQLFAECQQIIRRDQQSKGEGIYEINKFVDDYLQTKNAVIKDLHYQQLWDLDNIQIDEASQLYKNLQKFMLKLWSPEKPKFKVQDCPTAQEFHKNCGNQKSVSIVNQIRSQTTDRQNQFAFFGNNFRKNQNSKPSFAKPNMKQHSVYNTDNRQKSFRDLQQLHKQYNEVVFDNLKFIYLELGDYLLCKQFLQTYYSDAKTKNIPQNISQNRNNRNFDNKKFQKSQKKSNEKENQKKQISNNKFMHFSLEQLRVNIIHQMKLRYILYSTRRSIKNKKQSQELQRLANQNLPLIRQMQLAAKIKIIEYCRKNDPLQIDLHGFFSDQFQSVLRDLIQMIKSEYRKGKERIKHYKKNSKVMVKLTVNTGKGQHSQGHISVLRPLIQDWCVSYRYSSDSTLSDKIIIQIQLQ